MDQSGRSASRQLPIRRRSFLALAGAAAVAPPAVSEGGKVAEGALDYHLFLGSRRQKRPVLVLVHGVSTQAATMVELAARRAAENEVPLFAPDFHAGGFDEYQRLGTAAQPLGAARALAAALGEAAKRHGFAGAPIDLMGFSGGAQFVHRFALFFPQLVRRVVIAAPGWYTFLDEGEAYPYGIGPADALGGQRPRVEEFLKIPKLVAVGAGDTVRDRQLRRGKADEQGRNRLERARKWVAHVNAQGERRGLPPSARLQVLANTGHSVAQAMRRGGLGEKMFDFLTSDAPLGDKAARERADK